MEAMTISKAARELGCSERWLREAEKEGRIPTARRNLNGWRVYTQEDIAKLKGLLTGSSAFRGENETNESASQSEGD